MNTNRWVDSRLASLDEPGEWQPDSARARARLREIDRQAKRRRRWAWVAAAAASLGMLAFVQPRACANPRGCVQTSQQQSAPPAPVATSAAPAPVAAVAAQAKRPAPAPAPHTRAVRNYKETGAVDAPIACEVYSDYECPSCAAFYRDTMPLLVAEYIETGKVKLLHRDFPLPQHRYAKLAARYANAAGEAGQYEIAVNRLFQTQEIWGASGDIEGQLAPALPFNLMRKVHDLVEHGARLDGTMEADLAKGLGEGIHMTPSMVVICKGKRQTLAPIPAYALLKSYFDDLLKRK